MLIGLFTKMAVCGVHIWLPYAHAEAPTPVSALLSPNLIGIGAYALLRIPYTLFPKTFGSMTIYMLLLALVTMFYGGLIALSQDDFKRFLAYSSISQMGYLLLGIASLSTAGIAGAMLHYASHAVGKALLFTVAGCLIVQLHGLRSINKMGGLAFKMPLTASLALIGFMHIVGIPPSLGFWSEILIVLGVTQRIITMGSLAFILVVIALLATIGLSTAYAFITMKRIFFGTISENLRNLAKDGNLYLLGPILVIAIMGIILFFYPTIFIDPLINFIQSTFQI
jgi:NADH-quinone oxidoreductase subunit M